MTQTNILLFTLLAMVMPVVGYVVAWLIDPRRLVWQLIREYGEFQAVAYTVNLTHLMAEMEAEMRRVRSLQAEKAV